MIQNWLWRILNCQSCSRYLMVFSIRIGLVLIVFNCLAILTDLRILRIWSEYKQICQNAKPSYPTKIAWAWIRSLKKEDSGWRTRDIRFHRFRYLGLWRAVSRTTEVPKVIKNHRNTLSTSFWRVMIQKKQNEHWFFWWLFWNFAMFF